MIQRIQTLFLALSSGASFSLFGLPFSRSTSSSGTIYADQVMNLQDHTVLLISCILAGLLSLVAIFLFKNRRLQMSLGYGSVLASFALLAMVGYMQGQTSTVSSSFELGIIMPLAGVLFSLLAIRFIKKDDKLVSSMDRLR